MARQRVVKTSFNAGEFSPRVYGRIDIEKYANGCKTMHNMLPMPHGGATARPGLEYIAGTKTNAKLSRLIPFQFSTTQAYIIEAGYRYMRFYKDGGQIETVPAATKLLLHMDAANASTTFTDEGSTVHTVTANGTVQHTTSTKKFGISSGLFPGSGDYLSVPDHADFDILSETNFTVDLWARPGTWSGSARYLVTQWEAASDFWSLRYVGATGLQFVLHTSSSETLAVTDSDVPATGEWIHIAVCKVSDEYGIYINGEQKAYVSDASTDTFAGSLYIGADGAGNNAFEGLMDEIRIHHGNPLSAAPVIGLTDTITPPTAQYPDGDDSGTVYELATTYEEDELANLRWVQSADVLFITSPDRLPRKVTRTAHNAWTIADFAFDTVDWPPFLDMNVSTITMDASATTGAGIDLVASSAYFASTHVGAYFAMHSGYMKITAVTNSTNAVATVIDDLTAHTATANWFESSWSDKQGWPTVVTFYEDRLCFSGTSGNPDRIELSKTGEYNNFKRGELDAADSDVASDGLAITLSSRQVNAVRWMASIRKLLVGTTGSEWWIDGKDSSSAIDATELPRARNDSDHGSAAVAPASMGSTVFFVQRLNRVIRAFSYNWEVDQYVGRDMSILAEHLTNYGNITELAWQQTPHQVVWALRSDGVLLGLTYMREHQVEGWHRHTVAGTDAKVESIATIEGENEDELWCVVKRTINSATVRYVERMAPLVQIGTGEGGSTDWTLPDAFFVDSGLTYRGAGTSTVTGLSHLEGETVQILGDGVVLDNDVVASGQVSLTTSVSGSPVAASATVVHVGLAYNCDLQPLWPIIKDGQGVAIGIAQSIKSLKLMLYKSAGGKFGRDSSNLVAIKYDNSTDWDEGSRSNYYSGITEELPVDDGYKGTPTPYFRQDDPLPFTVLASITEIEV
jgi:hypothetical protein